MATLNAGSGADGNATVAANKNISTESLVGRGYGDMISYSCSSVGTNSCVATVAPDGIVAGDEVLLINLQGTNSNYTNVGNYETFIVDNINSNTITFTTDKTKYFGDGASDDTNIGTSDSNQRVMVQRVPQYANLTIDNGYLLRANTWNGTKDGVLFIRGSGTVLVNGTIAMSERGFRGGINTGNNQQYQGDSYPKDGALDVHTRNYGGGGAGDGFAGGGGGGYGTIGVTLSHPNHGQGGTTYGEQTLAKLFLGSGAGAGGAGGYQPALFGGYGAGLIAIFTTTLDVYGSILCDGMDGDPAFNDWMGSGGGGSGGSILIHAGTIYTRSSTFTSIGGLGGLTTAPGWVSAGHGGDGGDGRIAIHYASLGDNLSAVDPVPYTDSGLQLPYSISGTASEDSTIRIYDSSWGFIKSQAASAGSYQISNLPNPGPFFVIADPDGAARNILGYKGVIPTQ